MITRWIILTSLMIGLTFASFGHHTVAPDKQAQAQAYILAGGDWADLCSDNGDPLGGAAKCIACVIGHGCALPALNAAPIRATQGTAVAWVAQDQAVQPLRSLQSHTARAPPFI